MPVWYDKLAELRDEGEVELVGLIQEQHPDRCRLFLQWQQMDFPVLVDTLNRLGVPAVPMLWAIDEHGVVRRQRPDFGWFAGEFLETEYAAADSAAREVKEEDAEAVGHFLAGDYTAAIASYEARTREHPRPGPDWFRLGCAYRARYDSPDRQDGDFQSAIQAWTAALDLDPNHYIWRRRVEQYGPTMMKPYPFYDWVAEARAAIEARGEVPVELVAEPRGAELAEPARAFSSKPALEEPDPGDEITHDQGRVRISTVVAPCPIRPGQSARISVTFEPDGKRQVCWTNDAGPLRMVVKAANGWKLSDALLTSDVPADAATSAEPRILELEALAPGSAGEDGEDAELQCYALYYVCEGSEGECLFLRQDLSIRIPLARPSDSDRE